MVSAPVELEHTVCPLCGSDDAQMKYTLEDYYTRQPGQFTLVQCRRCHLVYLNPRPTAQSIGFYYPASYEPHAAPQDRRSRVRVWLEDYGWHKRCQPLVAGGGGGKVLDVGCGNGRFLAEMQQYGWQGVGLDLNPDVIEFVRRKLGIEAYVGQLEQQCFSAGSFDAVTLWDTLEHLPDPRSTLSECRRILKEDGRLLLRVPTLDALDAQLFGRYYAGLDSPRHLVVFTRETITRLLKSTGFEVDRAWCLSGSRASFVLSLRLLFSRKKQKRWGGVVINLAASLLGGILSAPYFYVIDHLRRGPELTVLARKSMA